MEKHLTVPAGVNVQGIPQTEGKCVNCITMQKKMADKIDNMSTNICLFGGLLFFLPLFIALFLVILDVIDRRSVKDWKLNILKINPDEKGKLLK